MDINILNFKTYFRNLIFITLLFRIILQREVEKIKTKVFNTLICFNKYIIYSDISLLIIGRI
jgi:hypothetical protein